MERSRIGAASRRAGFRFTAAFALVAAGTVAGCSGSHFNAVPEPAQPAAQEYHPLQRGLQIVRGHIRPEMLSAPLVGTLPLRRQLHLAIGLPLRDRAAAATLLDGVSDPRSGNYRHYLSPAEFQSRFSPSSGDYQSVIAFVRAAGLTVTRTYENRVVIDVDGSVAAIQRAFHLTLQTRRRPDGSLFFAPSNEPALSLRTPILHVAGLDDETFPNRQSRRSFLLETFERTSAFGPTRPVPAERLPVRIFTMPTRPTRRNTAPANASDWPNSTRASSPPTLARIRREFGLPQLPPQPILLDGYNGQPVVGPGEVETALDIEVAQAMASGVSNIFVFEGSLTDSILSAMTSSPCSQFSVSWTFGVDPTSQQLVDQLALQGQSFFVSSGDGGGFLKDTKDDRDMSNTVVVGGTELTLNADSRWQSETAWSGSGGGVEKKSTSRRFSTASSLREVRRRTNAWSPTSRWSPPTCS